MTTAATAPATVEVPSRRPPVSVLILTLNEEVNIADCLASCAWSDDVHVLDSGSEDRTVEIARSLGAQVHVHPFESFGKQRNWAIDNIPLKYDWVFHLDADERFTPALVAEIDRLLSSGPSDPGFHCPSKMMFMGRWLRRASGYPTYQMRLFHKHRMRFKDYGHGQREATDTPLRRLREPYLHYSFSKGLHDWLDKHNRYSSLEALQVLSAGRSRPSLRKIFSRDPVERRRTWKEIGYRIPFRPFIRWFVTLFVLGGILEGRPAWTYAQLLALYERMITVKLRLLRERTPHAGSAHERGAGPAARTTIFNAGDRRTERNGHPLIPGVSGDLARPDASGLEELGQLTPESSPWTFREKVLRAVWMLVGRPLFRISFHNAYAFRAWLLRLFGARVGRGVRIRPTVHVEIPWNLDLRDGATIGDYAILYSLGHIIIGERTIVSQYAHLCAGTHDHTDRRFPLIRDPIEIGPDAWIGADAFVGPNVRIGRLCVLGARASAYKDLQPAMVFVGNPARPLKQRELK